MHYVYTKSIRPSTLRETTIPQPTTKNTPPLRETPILGRYDAPLCKFRASCAVYAWQHLAFTDINFSISLPASKDTTWRAWTRNLYNKTTNTRTKLRNCQVWIGPSTLSINTDYKHCDIYTRCLATTDKHETIHQPLLSTASVNNSRC
jgi:hypothetical protein